MPSYYIPDLTPASTKVLFSSEEAHHALRVARHRSGDIVTITSGNGVLARAELVTNGREVWGHVQSSWQRERSHWAVAFALLQNKNDFWLVEKLTELGVSELFPFTCARSVRLPNANTVPKFTATALAAIKQCDNGWLPRLHPVTALEKTLANAKEAGFALLVASERERTTRLAQLHRPGLAACMIIGPEGGFDDREFALFTSLQVNTFKIADLVMRAETAAVASAAQWVGME